MKQLFGGPIHGTPTPIAYMMKQKQNMADVIVEGVIDGAETRGPFKNKNGTSYLHSASIYDGNTSMYFKFFLDKKINLKDGQYLRLKGLYEFDNYKKEYLLTAQHGMQGEAPDNGPKDEAPVKRGELAFLSKMSRHMSTLSIEDGVRLAKKMGHPYLALTDKEVAQGYPDAFGVAKKEDFKVIYGLTMNMVDDSQPIVFHATDERIDQVSYTVWDFETTGLSTEDDDIIEFGATKFEPFDGYHCDVCKEDHAPASEDSMAATFIREGYCERCFGLKGKERDEIDMALYNDLHDAFEQDANSEEAKTAWSNFAKHMKPSLLRVTHKPVSRFREIIFTKKTITPFITELTGHSQEVVNEGKPFREVMEAFHDFWQGTVLVAHNAPFDMDMLLAAYKRIEKPAPKMVVLDTLQLARVHRKDLGKHGLSFLSKAYGVVLEQHHRADLDAEATGEILVKMIVELMEKGVHTFHDINNMRDEEYFSTFFSNEIRLWVQTQEGLKNLYKLISESHTTYLHRAKPIIPKRIVDQYREGLLIGTSGIRGEIFELALNKRPEQVADAIAWYDVVELQPTEVASHLVRQGRCESEQSIDRVLKTMYDIAKQQDKIIVATGDVQYESPKDRMAHHILLYKSLTGRKHEASDGRMEDPQGLAHFRTTEEMLEAFSWLPKEEAEKVVIHNPQAVADSCGVIEIIPKELFTPKIEGANEELEEMTMNRAHALYGNPLPDYVQARIDKELKAILGYGFGVIYLISQKLVKNSVDNGYLVGSRGSVGSSLVATMTGITEVNPLKPHYNCTSCKWAVFFDHEEIQSGYDLPRSIRTLFDEDKYGEQARQHFADVLTQSLGKERFEEVKQQHQDDVCPVCQAKDMLRDGHDIPFETFLGFKGDKVPDIDLNFSGEYQGNAHRYVEELFGSEYVFRAGTVGTVADNTAFGYVKAFVEGHKEHYQAKMDAIKEELKQMSDYQKQKEALQAEWVVLSQKMKELENSDTKEEQSDVEGLQPMAETAEKETVLQQLQKCEEDIAHINDLLSKKETYMQELDELKEKIDGMGWSSAESGRLANVIKGSRRTSGQHPGGMLVVPDYKDIHDFTPYQYPANQKYNKDTGEENQQTSHFDFHAIHDNILKLDILGHDDPTELKILKDLTGIDPKDVPSNDEKVLKLFTDAEAAGIPLSRIEAKTGTLGVPEFGTEFVQEMILDTKPTTFAELVKISGLSHGENVWINNAQDLVRSGTATLKEVIDTRDNIMVYLIQKGLEDSLAFTIMESVRKGKGLTPEMEEAMRASNVDEWYIDSCKKIKYMFPKAHASAYVLSAMRIAYFKVYFPKEYYAAHLSVRSPNQDVVEIMKDSESLRYRIKELAQIIQQKKNARPKQNFTKDKELKDTLDLVLEAKERGVQFAPPRLYGSKAKEYIIDGDTLVAPFFSIPGIGDNAAVSLYEEAQKDIFRGIDDMVSRTGVSNTVVQSLRQLGCLELVEEMQHTLF